MKTHKLTPKQYATPLKSRTSVLNRILKWDFDRLRMGGFKLTMDKRLNN